MAPSVAWSLLATAICSLLLGVASAMDHIVGGSFGWKVPPNATFYQEWAKSRTFQLNDQLVFLYTSALHNVLEVSETDFDGCTQDKVIGMHPVGPATIPLTKEGNHYFFCGIATHCDQSLKLSITVGKTAGSSTATGADDDGAPDTSPNSSATMLHYFSVVLGLVMLSHLFVYAA